MKVELDCNSVVLTTSIYPGWEQFRDDFLFFIDQGIGNRFGTLKVARLGLRYKDVIQRSMIGLNDVSWGKLINPYLSNLHNVDDDVAKQLTGEQNLAVFRLPEVNGRLNVNYGLVTNAVNSEQCYLIGRDFIYEGALDELHAREYLDRYNVKARNFFRWCLSERLHGALGPVPV